MCCCSDCVNVYDPGVNIFSQKSKILAEIFKTFQKKNSEAFYNAYFKNMTQDYSRNIQFYH